MIALKLWCGGSACYTYTHNLSTFQVLWFLCTPMALCNLNISKIENRKIQNSNINFAHFIRWMTETLKCYLVVQRVCVLCKENRRQTSNTYIWQPTKQKKSQWFHNDALLLSHCLSFSENKKKVALHCFLFVSFFFFFWIFNGSVLWLECVLFARNSFPIEISCAIFFPITYVFDDESPKHI